MEWKGKFSSAYPAFQTIGLLVSTRAQQYFEARVQNYRCCWAIPRIVPFALSTQTGPINRLHSSWKSQGTQAPRFPLWGQDALGVVALEVLRCTHIVASSRWGRHHRGKTPLWCMRTCFLVVEHSLGTWGSKPLLGRVTTSPFPVLAPRTLHPRNWTIWWPYLLGFWNQEDRVQLWLCHFLAAVALRQNQLLSLLICRTRRMLLCRPDVVVYRKIQPYEQRPSPAQEHLR